LRRAHGRSRLTARCIARQGRVGRHWVTKILLISGAIAGAEEAPGEEWSRVSGAEYKGNLLASAGPPPVDYDIFILDPGTIQAAESAGNLNFIQTQVVERVAGGGCLICFTNERQLAWLPVNFGSRGHIVGKRFTVDTPDDPLANVLLKRESEVSFKAQMQQPQGWTAVARALDTYPIAGHAKYGAGLVLMLPEFKNRAVAIRDILDNVVPKLLPELQTAAPSVTDEEPPAWLNDFPIPAAHALEGKIGQLDQRISNLRDKREEMVGRQRQLAGYQGLLWLEGRPLRIGGAECAESAGHSGRAEAPCRPLVRYAQWRTLHRDRGDSGTHPNPEGAATVRIHRRQR